MSVFFWARYPCRHVLPVTRERERERERERAKEREKERKREMCFISDQTQDSHHAITSVKALST